VQEVLGKFVFTIPALPSRPDLISQNINNILTIRLSTKCQRPPQIILLGPPGSGRTTQANKLAQQFGLVKVSTFELLKREAKRNPDLGRKINQCIEAGELIPSGIVNNLIEQTLSQPDCQINGWVLEGFPMTEAQVNTLSAMGLQPTNVFILSLSETNCTARVSHRRIDPVTGYIYNLKLARFADEKLNREILDSMG
jgi:adenylate kinase